MDKSEKVADKSPTIISLYKLFNSYLIVYWLYRLKTTPDKLFLNRNAW